jgi:hypothetical protein
MLGRLPPSFVVTTLSHPLKQRLFTCGVLSNLIYIPTDYLYFTFGRRLEELGGGQLRRTLTPENMETVRREVLLAIEMQGKPFLSFFNDTQDLARAAARERGSPGEFLDCDPKDPHVAEARAYSWILADELDKALADLHYLISDPELKPEEEWEFVIQQRAREVLAVLNRGPEQAKALLTEHDPPLVET